MTIQYLAERLVCDCQVAVQYLWGSERSPVWLQQGIQEKLKMHKTSKRENANTIPTLLMEIIIKMSTCPRPHTM